ncbi:hypothetical protein GUJ93_ZPchr0006g44214 [Zizania palustris]|uniref:Uncharacterized protein n=1 Tax=Zizania palustris TaxID=103762 RepID=A0A8J5W1X0_ZIZPA|nr:hypothetical protein GUJ93_ZPchr0006g44214 [Zizania palustris]
MHVHSPAPAGSCRHSPVFLRTNAPLASIQPYVLVVRPIIVPDTRHSSLRRRTNVPSPPSRRHNNQHPHCFLEASRHPRLQSRLDDGYPPDNLAPLAPHIVPSGQLSSFAYENPGAPSPSSTHSCIPPSSPTELPQSPEPYFIGFPSKTLTVAPLANFVGLRLSQNPQIAAVAAALCSVDPR